jgi:vacuolar-type H+-ATPase subunit I/STV1
MPIFERVLWRALRGNLHMLQVKIVEPIVDPLTEELVQKDVFGIFAHGTEIMKKIRKIAESLGGTIYNVDANDDIRRDNALNVRNRLTEVVSVSKLHIYTLYIMMFTCIPICIGVIVYGKCTNKRVECCGSSS